MANKERNIRILLTAIWAALSVGLLVAVVVLCALAAPTGVLPIAVAVLGGVLILVGLVGGLGTMYLWRTWRQ